MEKMECAQAVLVGICTDASGMEQCERSLCELERLLETAGGRALAKVIQNKEHPNPRTCIGSGKVLEVREICRAYHVELVIFDLELSPAQIKNLEDDLHTQTS